MKTKKILKISLSILITVFSLISLFFVFKIINSRPVNKVFEFVTPVTIKKDIVISDNQSYVYNIYGGNFSKSEKYSLPLSQFENQSGDFEYYLFNNTFYAAQDYDAEFNGANTQNSFIHKSSGDTFLFNTEDFSVKTILEDNNIISCSQNGAYFLEQDGNEYYFHKLKSPDFDFYSPIKLNIKSDVCTFHFWINDLYALFSCITDKGELYFIANAENGETAPAYSIQNSFEDFQKELISDRFFVSGKSNGNVQCFNIYLQETSNFKFDNAESGDVLAISHNATYAVIKDNNEVYIVSNKGKTKAVSELLNGECVDAHFLLDNIVILTSTNKSEAYKLMF